MQRDTPSAADRTLRDQIVGLDKRHVWHPYTEMSHYIEEVEPLVIAGARGSRLFDLDGRSYIDGNASWWVSLLGHGHPRLLKVLREQSERYCHVPLANITHEPAARLAQELSALAPGDLCKVFYSDNGSTAVELALKIALQYHFQNGAPRRRRFVALTQAFHGETLGVTSVGGVELFRRPFAGNLLECVHVPPGEDGYERAFAAIEQLLDRESETIAACVVEPLVQGAGGMRVYAPEALTALRRWTRERGVFLIVDEVFTGYGRTGPMWACQHASIEPDILCMAKGFTAGVVPMAATLTTPAIFDGFTGGAERALYYGHTYCGYPLGAAIAREVLAIYRDERILERAQPKAERLAQRFGGLGDIPGVRDVRALGMVAALSLGSQSTDYLNRLGWKVYERALALGAYVRPLGNVIYLAPALNIPDSELEALLDIVERALKETLGENGLGES